MTSYTVTHNTAWGLFERAAKAKYGRSIKVVKTKWAKEKLDNLAFEISIVRADKEPKEANRIITDINMKEYTNRSQKEVDETLVTVNKASSKSTEDRYQYTTTKGTNWGIGGNIGAQVMGAAMAGGSVGISANYGKSKSTIQTKHLRQKAATFHILMSSRKKYWFLQ